MKNLDELKLALASVKTVEELPTIVANVASFVDVLSKASEEHAAARKNAETQAAESQAKLDEVQAKLAEIAANYNKLVEAQAVAAAETVFQTRMASVEGVFTFDDEARADIIKEVKACDSDETFATWMTKAKRLYKGYLKEVVATVVASAKKEESEDEIKAAAELALKQAQANVTSTAIENTVSTQSNESLKDRFAKLASKNIRLGGSTLEEIDAASKKQIRKTGQLPRERQ